MYVTENIRNKLFDIRYLYSVILSFKYNMNWLWIICVQIDINYSQNC